MKLFLNFYPIRLIHVLWIVLQTFNPFTVKGKRVYFCSKFLIFIAHNRPVEQRCNIYKYYTNYVCRTAVRDGNFAYALLKPNCM